MSEYEVYFSLAIMGTGLFLLKFFFLILGAGNDFDIHDGGEAFEIFSLQTILAILMGFGWAGLALRFEYDFSSFQTLLGSIFFGICIGLLSSLLIYTTRKLNHSTPEHMPEVGSIGQVYLTIPDANVGGKGQVELIIGGTKKIIEAITPSSNPISSFSQVKVTQVNSRHLVTVDKL